jgi:hypothetical protein
LQLHRQELARCFSEVTADLEDALEALDEARDALEQS